MCYKVLYSFPQTLYFTGAYYTINLLVTLFGIVTLVSLLQPENALSPMLVTLSGIVTLVRPLQPENADFPMLVTLSGIVTLVSPLQL